MGVQSRILFQFLDKNQEGFIYRDQIKAIVDYMSSEYPELDPERHAVMSKLLRIYRTATSTQRFTEDSFGLYLCETKDMVPNTADGT